MRSPIAAQRFTYNPRTGFGVGTSSCFGRRIESGTTTVSRGAEAVVVGYAPRLEDAILPQVDDIKRGITELVKF